MYLTSLHRKVATRPGHRTEWCRIKWHDLLQQADSQYHCNNAYPPLFSCVWHHSPKILGSFVSAVETDPTVPKAGANTDWRTSMTSCTQARDASTLQIFFRKQHVPATHDHCGCSYTSGDTPWPLVSPGSAAEEVAGSLQGSHPSWVSWWGGGCSAPRPCPKGSARTAWAQAWLLRSCLIWLCHSKKRKSASLWTWQEYKSVYLQCILPVQEHMNN